MIMSQCKQITVFLLLAAVFCWPLSSLAYDGAAGASMETCACQQSTAGGSADQSNGSPDDLPDNNAGDCCDSEESSQDSVEPLFNAQLRENTLVSYSHPNAHNHIPEVYLPIFVPPES